MGLALAFISVTAGTVIGFLATCFILIKQSNNKEGVETTGKVITALVTFFFFSAIGTVFSFIVGIIYFQYKT